MKFTGKATEIAEKLIDLFKNGDPGQAISNMFLKGSGLHCDKYSWNNRLLVFMAGYSDAMGFKQWKAKGRTVKKGEKALYILAPLSCTGEKTVKGVKEKYQFIRGFRGVPTFGYEQTEGEELSFNSQDNEHLSGLPLLEVAQSWGISVGSYAGKENGAAGYFTPDSMAIMLGVKNISTWLHELVHAAESKLGFLTTENYKEQKLECEIVAELGGCVLAHTLGLHTEADNGGCWNYIKSWSKQYNKDAGEAAYKLINRTCQAVDYILKANEEIKEVEESELETVEV
jgi:antirestriction protein ArdC|tara:strand:- start:432 stop:1286 length:855 start_codon:yes stop_codon:yes gene_type:complete